MKALVYTKADEVVYRDEPDPVPGEGQVLVKVAASGICGSDMHAYHGHDPRRVPPLILGHEVAGTVASGERKGRTRGDKSAHDMRHLRLSAKAAARTCAPRGNSLECGLRVPTASMWRFPNGIWFPFPIPSTW